MSALTDRVGGLDSAKVGGIIVVGAVLALALIRRGFGSVSVRLGD